MSDSASHLTVRRVPKALASALSRERKRRKASMNSTVIGLLSQALGIEESPAPRSNGLTSLAGSWSPAEMKTFEMATEATRRIDKELWR